MSGRPWMIYGANGYTGRLVAERAQGQGLFPVLAGRDESKVRPLAEKLGLPWKAFGLSSAVEAAQGIKDVDLVLHCAGPFSATSRPMVDACLKTGTHYLDITGEIDVFESIFAREAEAQKAGSVLMPGVGFDVVPSDCLAATLKEALPDATDLDLAFQGLGKASPGTTKTAVEGLPQGGKARRGGKIVKVPPAYKVREAPLGGRMRTLVSIPWGDVSTAYYSTGIANITTYIPMPKLAITAMKFSRPFLPLLGLEPVQNFLKKIVEKRIHGPTAEDRASGRVYLWGEARNAAGKKVSAALDVPEGYDFTVLAALACAERVLAGEVPPGCWTPSKAFGADFVTRIPGTKMDVQG